MLPATAGRAGSARARAGHHRTGLTRPDAPSDVVAGAAGAGCARWARCERGRWELLRKGVVEPCAREQRGPCCCAPAFAALHRRRARVRPAVGPGRTGGGAGSGRAWMEAGGQKLAGGFAERGGRLLRSHGGREGRRRRRGLGRRGGQRAIRLPNSSARVVARSPASSPTPGRLPRASVCVRPWRRPPTNAPSAAKI